MEPVHYLVLSRLIKRFSGLTFIKTELPDVPEIFVEELDGIIEFSSVSTMYVLTHTGTRLL